MNTPVLVNKTHPVPDGFDKSVELVNVHIENDYSILLEKETAAAYRGLRDYLGNLGIRILGLSGYRSRSTQERIWNTSVKNHGHEHTKMSVAVPGYSEHETGMAFDITLYDDNNEPVEDSNVEAYEVILPYLHKFGLILRYPQGKEDETGYSYEPWHYRYVGLEAARIIHENGWTLEEYLRSQEEKKPLICYYSGNIRNRARLCEELGISVEGSTGDIERRIIMAGYSRWGAELGEHIFGSFAIVLRDTARAELIAIRDFPGIEPLYYHLTAGGELLISTDISEIARDSRYTPEIDRVSLLNYMWFGYVPGERTIYSGIRTLLPGRYLIFKEGQISIRTWYEMKYSPETDVSEDVWAERIRQTLGEIIEDDKNSNPAAEAYSFLSGGVDSSWLLAASGARHACSIGYEGDPGSESGFAAETAGILGADLTVTDITSEIFFNTIPCVIKSVGSPYADASAVALATGCARIKGKAGLCYSGEGADELFAGYYVYQRACEPGKEGSEYFGCDGVMPAEDAAKLLGVNVDDMPPASDLTCGITDAVTGGDNLAKMQMTDIIIYFEGDILRGVHEAASSNGLLLSLPFADLRMFDLALKIPSDLKIRDGISKYIFRKAASSSLPHDTAFRKKSGFYVPVRKWLRSEKYRDIVEEKIFGDTAKAFFDLGYLRLLWNDFLEGNDLNWKIIYAVYTFVIWYQECFVTAEEGRS